jgi:hypothetical protein
MNTEIIERAENKEAEDKVAKMLQEIQKKNEAEAVKKAEKILKKNRSELNRLYAHAQEAAIQNNFEAYEYAIKKSRDILRQPYTDELIKIQWVTTRQAIEDIINGISK